MLIDLSWIDPAHRAHPDAGDFCRALGRDVRHPREAWPPTPAPWPHRIPPRAQWDRAADALSRSLDRAIARELGT